MVNGNHEITTQKTMYANFSHLLGLETTVPMELKASVLPLSYTDPFLQFHVLDHKKKEIEVISGNYFLPW